MKVEAQIRAMIFSPGTAPVLFRSAYTETTVSDLDNLRKVINLSAVGDGDRFSFETEDGAEITIPKALLLTTVFIVDVRPVGMADYLASGQMNRGEPTPVEPAHDHGEPTTSAAPHPVKVDLSHSPHLHLKWGEWA